MALSSSKTDSPTFADASAAIAWSSEVNWLHSTMKAKSLIGLGSGDISATVWGDGFVVINQVKA
jgi:hypothetical protein